MIVDLPRLLGKYRSKGLLLDSNLLVLLFVGLAAPAQVKEFKRTRNQGFSEKEFFLLKGIVGGFSTIITTPHLLTETSNYVCELYGELRKSALTAVASAVQAFKERRPEAKKLVKADAFLRFGLTDSAVLDLPPQKYLVLSVDAALVIALQKRRIDAINFNHLRQYTWEV